MCGAHARIGVERSAGYVDATHFRRMTRNVAAADRAEIDAETLCFRQVVTLHVAFTARPTELIGRREQVRGVRGAASAPASRTMAIDHDERRTVEFVTDGAAQATAGSGTGG